MYTSISKERKVRSYYYLLLLLPAVVAVLLHTNPGQESLESILCRTPFTSQDVIH